MVMEVMVVTFPLHKTDRRPVHGFLALCNVSGLFCLLSQASCEIKQFEAGRRSVERTSIRSMMTDRILFEGSLRNSSGCRPKDMALPCNQRTEEEVERPLAGSSQVGDARPDMGRGVKEDW